VEASFLLSTLALVTQMSNAISDVMEDLNRLVNISETIHVIIETGRTEEDLRSAIDRARQDPDVELAFPNQQNVDDMVLQGVECSPLDDPVYTEKGRGKGYEMIGVQKAWDLMRASGLPLFRVAVGVVDDGLFKGNDEFQGKASIDTSDPDSELANPKDQFGSHGTRIMNILAANPDNGG
jgi:hypothetical protein